MERRAIGAACIHHNVKVSFWRDLLSVLFVYIIVEM